MSGAFTTPAMDFYASAEQRQLQHAMTQEEASWFGTTTDADLMLMIDFKCSCDACTLLLQLLPQQPLIYRYKDTVTRPANHTKLVCSTNIIFPSLKSISCLKNILAHTASRAWLFPPLKT